MSAWTGWAPGSLLTLSVAFLLFGFWFSERLPGMFMTFAMPPQPDGSPGPLAAPFPHPLPSGASSRCCLSVCLSLPQPVCATLRLVITHCFQYSVCRVSLTDLYPLDLLPDLHPQLRIHVSMVLLPKSLPRWSYMKTDFSFVYLSKPVLWEKAASCRIISNPVERAIWQGTDIS